MLKRFFGNTLLVLSGLALSASDIYLKWMSASISDAKKISESNKFCEHFIH